MNDSIALQEVIPACFSRVNANLVERIWRDKYCYNDEISIGATMKRVITGVYAQDPNPAARTAALRAMLEGVWAPGGRILAGAGTRKRVTWANCFVNSTVEDSMEGIMRALSNAAITMQQGGGIGTDFSTIRPRGAIITNTGGISQGVLPFMDMWHSMCLTIMGSGARRGAMMGTLADWHPDLPDFIFAKQQQKRLTTFNVSILISDAFMDAVKNGQDWNLGFSVPSINREQLIEERKRDGRPWYIYQRLPARKLWEMIAQSTYNFSEPGVIFLDRVNGMNNLAYCETIQCTNPCAEQPLPPHGDCNLGSIVLPRFVREPFTEHARVDINALRETVSIGVRFLDNVIDRTSYPLSDQAKEAQAKRRIGLGVTGLANMLQMLGLRYGSLEGNRAVENVMQEVRNACYLASVALAKERGPFPFFDKDIYLARPFIRALPDELRDGIAEYGIRNGVLMTIAPTGTTSLLYGNVSSGIEPSFSFCYSRKILQPDGNTHEVQIVDWGFEQFCQVFGTPDYDDNKRLRGLPNYMVTALELPFEDHIAVQAVCQRYIDASISKTINCPAEMSFENFEQIYWKAYESGCKSCTTYRPSKVRGKVLSITPFEKTQSDTAGSFYQGNVSHESIPAPVIVPAIARYLLEQGLEKVTAEPDGSIEMTQRSVIAVTKEFYQTCSTLDSKLGHHDAPTPIIPTGSEWIGVCDLAE